MKAAMLAALALCTGSAMADSQFVLYGEGGKSCGVYLEHAAGATSPQNYLYVTWVRGFVSGVNWETQGLQVNRQLEAGTIIAYLDKYCREHPLDQVIAGAVALTQELRRGR